MQQVSDLEGKRLQAELLIGQGEVGPWERQLTMDRSSLVQIQMEEAKMYWRASTQRVYEMGDKNGKLLYWLVTGSRASPVIPLILESTGAVCTQAQAIAEAFAEFYTDVIC